MLRLAAPVAGLAVLALFFCLWCFDRSGYFALMAAWGTPAVDRPFADWGAVVGLMHCASRGIDVYRLSQCGLFMYSPLWAWAAQIPLTETWTTAVGLGMDIAFFTSFLVVCRPRTWWESAVFASAGVSSAAVCAVERANVDVILFLMAVLAASVSRGAWIRRGAGYLIILTAGLLKFYPIVGLVLALRESTARFIAIAFGALVAMAALLFAMRGDMANLAAGIPGGRYGLDAFGARNIVYLFGMVAQSGFAGSAALAAVGLVALALCLLVARTPGLAIALDTLEERDCNLLIVGAAIVVGCFFAGQNIGYRAIFLILVVGGLVPLRRVTSDAATRARLGWLIAATLALLWSAGVEATFYPNYRPVPAGALVLRELVWWCVIATMSGLLTIFAARSVALAFMRPWLVDRLKIGAVDKLQAAPGGGVLWRKPR